MRASLVKAVLFSIASVSVAFLYPQNPPWGPSNYPMSQATITMACNSSGWFDVGIGAAFGITSYDWRYGSAVINRQAEMGTPLAG